LRALVALGLLLWCLFVLFLPLPAFLARPLLGTLWPPSMAVCEVLLPLFGTGRAIGLILPVLLFICYALAAAVARSVPEDHQPLARRVTIGGACLFSLTLLLMPAQFSTDIYLYLFYGRMQVLHGLNPYSLGTAGLSVVPPPMAADIFLQWVPRTAEQAPLYGPLWMLYCRLVVWLAGPEPLHELLLFRLLQVTLACLIWSAYLRLAVRAFPRHALTALLLFAWNPLVQIEIAGEGHVDGLMILLLLPALGCLLERRDAAASCWLTLSLHTKLSVALVVAGWAIQLARFHRARVAFAVTVAVGLTALLFVPYGLIYLDVFRTVSSIMGTHYFNSFPLIAVFLVGSALLSTNWFSYDTVLRIAEVGVHKVLLEGVFAALFCWRMLRLPDDRERLVMTLGSFYLCLYLFVAPYTWPHYLVLPLALLCVVPRSPLRLAGLVFSCTFFYQHMFNWLGICQSTWDVVARLLALYAVPIGLALWALKPADAAPDTAAATTS
jgi:hypothetical protein